MGLLDSFRKSKPYKCQCSGCANCNKSEEVERTGPMDDGHKTTTRHYCTRSAEKDGRYCKQCKSRNKSSGSSSGSNGAEWYGDTGDRSGYL